MNIFATLARKTILMLACCATWYASQLTALELSDIHLPLTRSEADQTLSKDYTYALLADGTVRRTWNYDDKQIFIDFDTNTNAAILIAVVYSKPVTMKEGIADAHTLGAGKYSDTAKWDAPKDKASKDLISNTFGLNNAKRKKLEDKSMLFYETNGKKDKAARIVRVSLFSNLPKTNRWVLDTINPGERKTAMGNSWSNSFIEDIYKDEAQRQALPLRTNAAANPSETSAATTPAADSSASDSTPETPTTQRITIRRQRTGMGTRTDVKVEEVPVDAPPSNTQATPTTPKTTAPAQQRVVLERQEAKTETISTLPPPPDFLKNFGVEKPEWWHYIVLLIAALILLGIILSSIARAGERVSRQRKFNQVVGGTRKPRL